MKYHVEFEFGEEDGRYFEVARASMNTEEGIITADIRSDGFKFTPREHRSLKERFDRIYYDHFNGAQKQ